MESLENAIKEARKARRLTQGKVADKLKVARTTVSNWECGRSQPDLLTLRELSRLLHCDLFSGYRDTCPHQAPIVRKLRLKLSDSPVIEVISAENACVFTDFTVNLQVNSSDSHGNPVSFRLSAGFCVENDDD